MKKWILAAGLCCNVALADVAVIVNPNNSDALDKDSISRIFLNKAKALTSGIKAEPVALRTLELKRFAKNVSIFRYF